MTFRYYDFEVMIRDLTVLILEGVLYEWEEMLLKYYFNLVYNPNSI